MRRLTEDPGALETSAPNFYASPLGQMAAAAIARRVRGLWPDLDGQSVLGLGYPEPYLHLWRTQAYRCVAATTAHHTPAPGSAAIDAVRLPFPDLVFDRILVIHGVEPAGQDSRVLREIWRVLKDDGRILVVAPNRVGLWAHAESTPFGQGQPYSRGQLHRLLASAMFRAERHDAALFAPPSQSRLALRLAPLCEAAGHALVPRLCGAIVVEAVKDTYAALPTAAAVRRRVVLPEVA